VCAIAVVAINNADKNNKILFITSPSEKTKNRQGMTVGEFTNQYIIDSVAFGLNPVV
jgi:hypothetical protein